MKALCIFPTMTWRADAAHAAVEQFLACRQLDMDMLVVLDEASGDDVQWYVDRKLAVDARLERRGLTCAFNAGMAHFLVSPQYEFLFQLEDGVTVEPGWDTCLASTLRGHPEFGWVGCGHRENPAGKFSAMCSAMTREAAEMIYPYDLMFYPHSYEDADAIMRLRHHGKTPHGIDFLVSHPKSMTGAKDHERGEYNAVAVAHRYLWGLRWREPDFNWLTVPVHERCPSCWLK